MIIEPKIRLFLQNATNSVLDTNVGMMNKKLKLQYLSKQLTLTMIVLYYLQHSIIIIIIGMTQPVKYLSVVSKIVEIYQIQLLTMFKKIVAEISPPPADLLLFKNKVDRQIKKLKQIEDQKSIIDDKISDVCQPMTDFLTNILRVKNTSQSQRYAIRSNLRTQDTHRMRLTGGLKKNVQQQAQPINQSAEMDEIIKSYKIQQQIGPRMRMKWKSFGGSQAQQKVENQRKISRLTIGDNNIDLLSYTIPQIQNSIKRLSLQSGYSRQRSPQKIFEAYRTVDTRSNNRKKFVQRLI